MIDKIVNIFKIEELRNKIGFTLLIIAIYRLGGHIPVPGINTSALQAVM